MFNVLQRPFKKNVSPFIDMAMLWVAAILFHHARWPIPRQVLISTSWRAGSFKHLNPPRATGEGQLHLPGHSERSSYVLEVCLSEYPLSLSGLNSWNLALAGVRVRMLSSDAPMSDLAVVFWRPGQPREPRQQNFLSSSDRCIFINNSDRNRIDTYADRDICG